MNGIIWFELTNSPHINLFKGIINDLRATHDVLVTCRPLANTIDLLKLHAISHHVVGVHYGGRFAAKLFGFPIRVAQLRNFLSKKNIGVAISQSSFHSPVVSRLLGIRCIYMNDNEHALGNVPAFLCANTILVPEFLGTDKLKRQWANLKKVVRYPGVKEGIYLWQLDQQLQRSNLNRLPQTRRRVFVRPEPWTAQYYAGRHNFLDPLLHGMRDQVDIVVLPRGRLQAAYYEHPQFAGIEVVRTALDIAEIAPNCDLFIGAGGTMTREMAVLGIPTISVYQGELLDVDRYLLGAGGFRYEPNLTPQLALEYLESSTRRPPNRELLEKGRAAFNLIKQLIINGPAESG